VERRGWVPEEEAGFATVGDAARDAEAADAAAADDDDAGNVDEWRAREAAPTALCPICRLPA